MASAGSTEPGYILPTRALLSGGDALGNLQGAFVRGLFTNHPLCGTFDNVAMRYQLLEHRVHRQTGIS
jgi:hypothetical protein